MSRAVKSRSTLAGCLVWLLAVSAPTGATAAETATEQYQLTLPGVERGSDVGVAADSEPGPETNPGAGVTGERTAAPAPLAAVAAVLSSPWVLLTLAGVAGAVVVARRAQEPR